MSSPKRLQELTEQELRAVLDEEIHRLPEKYRVPVVLCYVQGKTQHEAAQAVGWPKSSLGSRLARARDLLQKRLVQRGIGVSAGLFATLLTSLTASAAVPALLTINTVRGATLTAAGKSLTSGVVTTKASALAHGVLKAMFMTKLKTGAILFLAATALALGGGLFAQHAVSDNLPALEGHEEAQEASKQNPPDGKAQAIRTDRFGDPLPSGAFLRLGTLRLRHKEGIASVTFAPNSRLVMTGGADDTVRLWDLDTGREVRRLEGHEGPAVALAVSPDGKRMATAGVKTIHLWEAASGKLLQKIPADTTRAIENGTAFLRSVPLVFSADGKLLAFITTEPSVRVWDVAAGKERWNLKGHAKPAEVLGFSADGKTLISASGDRSADGEVRLWDTTTGKERANLRVPLQLARSSTPFAVSPDGRTLAIEGLEEVRRPVPGGIQVSTGFTIRLWDLETLRERLKLSAQPEVIWSVAFSADSKKVAAALMGGRLIVWEAATGKPLQQCPGYPEGTRPDGGHTLAFSHDGKILAAVGSSAALSLWDVATGREALASADAHHSDVSVVTFSPDGRTIATAGGDHTIRLWDFATGRHRLRLSGHKDAVRALVFSSDGRTLASSSRDGAIRLWDTVAGKEIRTIQAVERTAGVYFGLCPLAFTPDGKGLVSWGDDRRLRVWDVTSGKERLVRPISPRGTPHVPPGRPAEFPKHDERILAVGFTADGRIAAVAFHEGIYILNVASGQELARMAAHPHVKSLAFSADGKNLVSGGWDKAMRLGETMTGREILKVDGLDHINAIAFAADGRTVATAAGWADGTISLFDAVTGKTLQQLKGHGTYVGSLAFSPDGKSLASGQRDTTALVWDVDATVNRPRATGVRDKDLAELWNDLASSDTRTAHSAIWRLADGGDSVAQFLQKRLPAVPHTDAKRIQKLIADLDSPQFALRESANRELASLGIEAHPALSTAMTGNLSAESRRRIETLLAGPLPRSVPSGDLLRRLRALQVLEHLDSPAAVKHLQTLANGAPGDRQTQEAKLAIQRKRIVMDR